MNNYLKLKKVKQEYPIGSTFHLKKEYVSYDPDFKNVEIIDYRIENPNIFLVVKFFTDNIPRQCGFNSKDFLDLFEK